MSELMVPQLTFGGNVFGWTVDEPASFYILDTLFDFGFNFVDTADAYSIWAAGNKGGESESIIGKWLKKTGKRKDVIIATKLGMDLGHGKKGLSAKYMKLAVEASLRRLSTDYIDLYQSHKDDLATTVEETMTAFNQLIKEGKVRYIGASQLSAERIRASNDFVRSNNLKPYISLQPLYNLCERKQFENEYSNLVRDEALGVIPYYSLASGFLTGKYRSEADLVKSLRGEGVRKYLDEKGFRILAAMDEIANELNVSLSKVAIAWLIQKPLVTAPIASATNEWQLTELLEGTSLILTPKQMVRLDNATDL